MHVFNFKTSVIIQRPLFKESGRNWTRGTKKSILLKDLLKMPVSELAYSPRLVTEVVDGVQRVDGGDAGVLQTNDQVPEVLILGHAVGVLANQDKVGLERPAGRWRKREQPGHQHSWGVWDLWLFSEWLKAGFRVHYWLRAEEVAALM